MQVLEADHRQMVQQKIKDNDWIITNPTNKTKWPSYKKVFGDGAADKFSYAINVYAYPIMENIRFLLKDEDPLNKHKKFIFKYLIEDLNMNPIEDHGDLQSLTMKELYQELLKTLKNIKGDLQKITTMCDKIMELEPFDKDQVNQLQLDILFNSVLEGQSKTLDNYSDLYVKLQDTRFFNPLCAAACIKVLIPIITKVNQVTTKDDASSIIISIKTFNKLWDFITKKVTYTSKSTLELQDHKEVQINQLTYYPKRHRIVIYISNKNNFLLLNWRDLIIGIPDLKSWDLKIHKDRVYFIVKTDKLIQVESKINQRIFDKKWSSYIKKIHPTYKSPLYDEMKTFRKKRSKSKS